ncbi:MAG TPA: multiheme c-type cytochrome, partial [Polyangiaceae bacterium]
MILRSIALLALAACASDPPQMTQDQLMDPQACAQCHPTHVAQWSGSMHAYASDDPIFVAMNARFQREVASSGADPSFCVKCHAPVALAQGATTDGTNLATLDAKLRGVTCFECHAQSDGSLGGPLSDPAHGASHKSVYSASLDLADPSSSASCGTCHDVKNGHGATVEATFSEWQASLYAQPNPSVNETCGACHTESSLGQAATTSGAPQRRIHDHSMAAFDVATTTFPNQDEQKTLVQQALDASIIAKLCVAQPTGAPNVTVTLDNAFVGHAFPSGAAHDRRVWVELHAYAAGTDVLDDSTWVMRTNLFDASNQPVKFLWQASTVDSSLLLPPAVTNDPNDPKYV